GGGPINPRPPSSVGATTPSTKAGVSAMGNLLVTDVAVFSSRTGELLDGLIDCHCHAYGISLDGAWIESRELSYVALVAARRLAGALHRGFTTVRDVA